MKTEDIKLGPCNVTYDGVDLGATIGGVEVQVATTTHETKVDQLGETVVKEYITGRNVSVKVPLAEATVDNMVALMPGATKVVDATDPTKMRVDVAVSPGFDLLKAAKPLVLHPVHLPLEDKSEDFTVNLANCAGELNFAYQLDQERVFTCNFKGYPDAEKGYQLYSYGDPDAAA